MQQSPSELKEKLLCALDKDYNVVDMATVIQVVSILEKLQITKEALEKTRLGRYVNELRKKTSNEQLARRAKDLVKGWRKLIPSTENTNGDRTAGGITPPGPGPGPGRGACRPGGAPTIVKPGLVGSRKPARFKPGSPAVAFERLASPLSLSASNSPLLAQTVQKTAKNFSTTSYAPVKATNVESLLPTSRSVFKPVSPALLAVKQSLTLNQRSVTPPATAPTTTITTPLISAVLCPKANSPEIPPCASSAAKIAPKSSQERSAAEEDNVHSSLELAKTNPANKRLRKSSEEDNDSTNGHLHRAKKVSLVNGGLECKEPSTITVATTTMAAVKASKWSAFESVRSSSLEENSLPEEPSSSTPPDVQIIEDTSLKPKKRGRRKLVKQDPQDLLKEKLAAAQSSRFHKVKTTQQLIEDLHAKNVVAPGTLAVVSPPSVAHALTEPDAKQELMDRFLKSSNSKITLSSENATVLRTNENISVSMAVRTPAMIDREIEMLLRSLPKIDPSVLEDDSNDEADALLQQNADLETNSVPSTIGEEELNRLSCGQWNRVNGMYDHENVWHSWQETATIATQNGETLHILPYVNIDW